jgi:RNA polymerase sigma factor (TIGR02999 family)
MDRTVTHLLEAWGQGSSEALEHLAPLVYGELRGLAAHYLRGERPGQTLETGALVNEAFLRLVDQRQDGWQNRSHFFGIAALMMRRVLVDHARSRQYARRGCGALHLPLDAAGEVAGAMAAPEILALNEAIGQLREFYPQASKVVELRFFAGLTEDEIGKKLGISTPTVKRRWRLARAWLYRYLSPPSPSDSA